MKQEFSAGGIIVLKKASQVKVLLLKDKTGKWTFPKGLIDKNEDKETTAIREIGEEVGIKKLRLMGNLKPVKYFYRWEGKLVHKTVDYFLFTSSDQEKLKPQREEGILDAKWWEWNKAKEIIGYKKSNTNLLNEAETILNL